MQPSRLEHRGYVLRFDNIDTLTGLIRVDVCKDDELLMSASWTLSPEEFRELQVADAVAAQVRLSSYLEQWIATNDTDAFQRSVASLHLFDIRQ